MIGHSLTKCLSYYRPIRRSTTQIRKMGTSAEPQELRISVPHGHIAAKQWGDPNGDVLLGIHGWMDNAASFDGIGPLLPPNIRFVCLDSPGHGLSSRYPPGMTYKVSDMFTIIHRVMEHFKWDKISLMGHSLGGGTCSWYAALFPEHVEKLVSIDLLTFGALPLNKQVKWTRKSIQQSVQIVDKMENHKVPIYTFEDAVARSYMAQHLMHGLDSISRPAVETILRRGLVPTPDGQGYTWGADLRLRIPTPFNILQETAEEYASKIECPHLFIKGSESSKYMSDEVYSKILKVYQNNNPNFVYRIVTGGHHLHLNDPQKLKPIINEFLDRSFANPDPEIQKFDLI